MVVYAADFLGTPFNYYAPRGRQVLTPLPRNSFFCMIGRDMAIQVRNTAVKSCTARDVRHIPRPEINNACKIYQFFAGQAQLSGFCIRLIWSCRYSSDAKLRLLRRIGQRKIGNGACYASPFCIVHFVTREGAKMEVAFPNMSHSPLPLHPIRAVSAPHTGGSTVFTHIHH